MKDFGEMSLPGFEELQRDVESPEDAFANVSPQARQLIERLSARTLAMHYVFGGSIFEELRPQPSIEEGDK